MKAVVLDPAPGLIDGLERPVPAYGEALLRTRLCGICNTDLELMRGYMAFSGIPGHEFVAEVAGINTREHERFAPGKDPSQQHHAEGELFVVDDEPDESQTQEAERPPAGDVREMIGRRVVGEINASCGKCAFCTEGAPTHCMDRTVLGILGRQGCMAEYFTLPLVNLHSLPDSVSDEAAVFVEPLAAAYEMLEQVDIGNGQRVLVTGDGKLGLLCAMVLSTTGADVTLMGRHKKKLSLAEPYGVRTVLSGSLDKPAAFDVVVEATGSADGFVQAMELTRPRGVIVLKSTVAEGAPVNLAPVVINEITVVGSRCGPFGPAIEALASGKIDPTPLIEATYTIGDAVKAFEHAAQKGALKVLVGFQE